MKILLALALILFGCTTPNIWASDVGALIEKPKGATSKDNGISDQGQEIAKELQHIGPEAIPYLLPLLRDNDKAVRDLASYALRDIDGLKEEHLDALIDSCRRGDGWIPPAIARIGTPKAV